MSTLFCLYCATVLEKQDKSDGPECESTWVCPSSTCNYKVSFSKTEEATEETTNGKQYV